MSLMLVAGALAGASAPLEAEVPGAPVALWQRAAPAQQERPIFRATLDRVRVDVIVTDAEGRFVDDLGPEDFVIYEDGERQEIRSLQLVDLAAGRVVDLAAGRVVELEAPGADVDGEENTGAVAETVRSADFGAVVYLIDFPGLDHRIKLHFVDEWNELLARTESLQLPHAVYLVDNVGRLREMTGLTTDVSVLRDAVEEVGETGLTIAPAVARGPQPEQSELSKVARTDFMFELLDQFSQALAARPGRTALVWVSQGVTLNGLSAGGRSRPMPGYFPNRRILNLQRDMHRAANSSNVSIYAVDPSRWADFLASIAEEGSSGGGGVAGDPLGDRSPPGAPLARAGSDREELGNSLRHAAEETGGRAYILHAELDEVLATIEEESSRYYLLTYAAPPPSGDGDYHEIRVEVSRSGVQVRGRRGYVDYTAEERRDRFISAALSQPGTVVDLPVTVENELIEWAGDRAVVETTVHIETHELAVGTGPNGARQMVLEVHAALLDDDLDLVDELHRELTVPEAHSPSGEDDPPDEQGRTAAQARPGEFAYRHRWRLRPGEYDLRVMVNDTISGRVGAVGVPLEISPPAAGAAGAGPGAHR